MIKAVVQIKEIWKEQARAASFCPVPHKYVYIILISKVLFIFSYLVNALLNICRIVRFCKVNHLQMLSINRNITAILQTHKLCI